MALVGILGAGLSGVVMGIQLKRLGIDDHIRLNTTVDRAWWQPHDTCWELELAEGERLRHRFYTDEEKAELATDEGWHRGRRQQYRDTMLWQRAFEVR